MGVQLDLTRRIVNVNWGGLAVEFFATATRSIAKGQDELLGTDERNDPEYVQGDHLVVVQSRALQGGYAPAKPWPLKPPPDKAKGLPLDVPQAFVFYDAYGEKGVIQVLTQLRGTPPLIYPFPPVTHRLDVASTLPQDKFNFLLTFGDPKLPYNYRPWVCEKISTFDGVLEKGFQLIFNYADWPPPYRPDYRNGLGPVGQNGKLPVYNLRLATSPEPRTDLIPQSFIGVMANGELRIQLQTNTRADYNGYMYIMDRADTLFAQSSILLGPPATPDNLFPDKIWSPTSEPLLGGLSVHLQGHVE